MPHRLSSSAFPGAAAPSAYDRVYEQGRALAQALAGASREPLVAAAHRLVEALRAPEVAARGIWHPYGFFVVKVGLFPEWGTLRLHVWPDAERRVQEPSWPVHCHRWHLASLVVAGTLENAWYAVRPGAARVLYACTRTDDGSVMTRTPERVSLRRTARQRLHAGADYAVGTDTYHATCVPEGCFAATFALTTLEPGRFEAFVAGAPEAEARYVYPREVVSPAAVAGALARIHEALR